jgi:hypothetical protein
MRKIFSAIVVVLILAGVARAGIMGGGGGVSQNQPFKTIIVGNGTSQPVTLSGGWSFNELRSQPLQVISTWQYLSDWTQSSVSGTQASVTQNPDTLLGGVNDFHFVAAQTSDGSYVKYDQNRSFNLSSANGLWLIYNVNYMNYLTGMGSVFYLSTQTSMGTSSNSGFGRWVLNSYPPLGNTGLSSVWVPISAWTVLDGTPSFTNPVLSWRVYFQSGNTEAHDFNILGWIRGGGRPKVLFTFDDGLADQYTNAWPAAEFRNIPLTFYLIPQAIGTTNYMTMAQVQTIGAAGNYLGLHGNNSWTTLSNFTADLAAMQALGISDCRHAAYPNGAVGAPGTAWTTIESTLAANGVLTARGAGQYPGPFLPRYCNLMHLPSAIELNSSCTLAAAEAVVDSAIASGGTVIFECHQIDTTLNSTTWTISNWQALLDYVAADRDAGKLDIVTIAQWYKDLQKLP